MRYIDNTFFEEISQYNDEELRDYQVFNKHEIYKKWGYKTSILLQMPTGTGKTRLFVSMINDFKKYCTLHNVQIKVLILTHRIELVAQIKNELFWNYNIKSTLITADNKDSHINPLPVCIASIQTLQRRLEAHWNNYPFNFIIIDEAHHTKAATYKKVLNAFEDSKILGVTATPYRLNGEGFTEEYEDLIVSPSVKQFIEAGWLSNYDYYSIKEDSDLYKGLDNIPLDKYGEYATNSLWHYINRNQIKSEIVGSYIKYARGKKAIIYTINKAHNKQLCQEFKDCGIVACEIDSDTSQDERKRIVKEFREGHVDVLCNVDIFTEGFDCPDVEVIQLARPTKSLGLYLQQVGRGLRIADGKRKVIFLDNIGLHNRFGFPASKRMWYKHYLGLSIDDSTRFIQTEDVREPFDMKSRNRDLSEGCEEMILIESTGINNILEEAKAKYISEKGSRLKTLINEAFNINRRVFKEYVTDYSELHMIFTSELVEDLVTPCSKINCECEDLYFWKTQIKKEFKPVIKGNEIVYESYQDLDDYMRTKSKMILSRFNDELRKSRSYIYDMLNEYTARQLYDFFVNEYGPNHNMTKKLKTFCLCGYEYSDWGRIVKLWNSSNLKLKAKDSIPTVTKAKYSNPKITLDEKDETFEIGDRVVHHQWGYGTITDVVLNNSIYCVDFDTLSTSHTFVEAKTLQKASTKNNKSKISDKTGSESPVSYLTNAVKIGDWLVYNSKRCKVINKDPSKKRLTVEYNNKIQDNINDDNSKYTLFKIEDAIPNAMKRIFKKVSVGDTILKIDDLSIGCVVEIVNLGVSPKILLKLESGNTEWIFNNPNLFWVLGRKE